MTCFDIIADYGLRSLGIGERLLPKSDITLCHHFVLIGSGMLWNIWFGVLAFAAGFVFSIALAFGKASKSPIARKLSEWFIFVFRGSPLFIQFFFCYFLFLTLKSYVPALGFLTAAAWGGLVVLFFNTSAYSAEIFYGAMRSIPKGEIEAADAYGFTGFARFKRITLPNMLRLAWPSYTNEGIFLFHATTLVFFSGFPVFQQSGDALYYASYIAGQTFNPFLPYPILALYFILLTLVMIGVMGLVNKRLNRHLPQAARPKMRFRLNLIR